ncbi:unnamed protein product [Acanthoscelides obtectus]|uniref:Uncharacterized protein n=2 Tax=Acanthoscelides obtectus TaxID=200917 RepID=A0A9P0LCR7_ACAOB|nr:unnamed protein product [Acanthoscelides obtectus]CAK1680739.1 hypothetical protein AOBTE_LOCUS32857 [Acanthoscelides obtectus]
MFADFIAQKMRKFSPHTRAVLQHQIHNLIFQAELDSLPISPQVLSPSQQTFQPSTSICQNFRTYNSLPSPSSSISSVGPPSCTPSPLQCPQSNIQQYNEHAPQQSSSEHSSTHSQEVPPDHQEITSENSLIFQVNSSQQTANQLTTATYFSKYDEI